MKHNQPQTKAEYVYAAIREDIFSGQLIGDQRLRLAELADRYDVSALPVREALRMLEREGLVTMISHRGAIVSRLTINRAIEHIEVRTYLEVYAARLATLRHTAQTIAELRKIVDSSRQCAENGRGKKFSEINRKFHTALYSPGTNLTLKAEISELWDKVWRVVEFGPDASTGGTGSVFEHDENRMHNAIAEHIAIIDAVERQRPDEVEKAMNVHREETLAMWLSIAKHHSVST
jgi:DNA-binding GntR family transcriptional regulator